MPQFLFNQSPSASSLQDYRHCFALFVLFSEIWIWILLDVVCHPRLPQVPQILAILELSSHHPFLPSDPHLPEPSIPDLEGVKIAAASLPYATGGDNSENFPWSLLGGNRDSSSSCFMLKHSKLPSIYQASPEYLKPGAVLIIQKIEHYSVHASRPESVPLICPCSSAGT